MQCPNCGRKVRSKHQCAHCGYVFGSDDKIESQETTPLKKVLKQENLKKLPSYLRHLVRKPLASVNLFGAVQTLTDGLTGVFGIYVWTSII